MGLIVLSPQEIKLVTGFNQSRKQCTALAQMDIPFRVRPDGTPLVVRANLEGNAAEAPSKPEAILTLI